MAASHHHSVTKTFLKNPSRRDQGPCRNIKFVYPRYGDSHDKDKTVDPRDRLIFNMGIHTSKTTSSY